VNEAVKYTQTTKTGEVRRFETGPDKSKPWIGRTNTEQHEATDHI